MNSKAIDETTYPCIDKDKSKESDVAYDSGLVSECDLSQNLSSEIDSTSSKLNFGDLYKKGISVSSRQEDYNQSSKYQSDQIAFSITDSGIVNDVSGLVSNLSEKSEEISDLSLKSVDSTNTSDYSKVLEQVFVVDEDGVTELYLAVLYKNENMVKKILQLITNSSYLDLRNYYGWTCLHLSVVMDLPQITRLLYLAGARTDIEDRNGNTALHLGCSMNNLDCVNSLLTPITIHEKKHISFLYEPRHDDASKFLNEYNYEGKSCLHLAASHDDRKIFNQLLLHGADINIIELKGGYTVLHEAVINGSETLVNYILQHHDIDVNKKTYARRTAFELSSGNPAIRQLILSKRCDPYESDQSDYSDFSDTETDGDSFVDEC